MSWFVWTTFMGSIFLQEWRTRAECAFLVPSLDVWSCNSLPKSLDLVAEHRPGDWKANDLLSHSGIQMTSLGAVVFPYSQTPFYIFPENGRKSPTTANSWKALKYPINNSDPVLADVSKFWHSAHLSLVRCALRVLCSALCSNRTSCTLSSHLEECCAV